jgi:hypothetical protein
MVCHFAQQRSQLSSYWRCSVGLLHLFQSNFTVTHSKGCMFSFTPYRGADPRFKSQPIEAGQKIVIPIVASEFFVSKYSMFPNWYLANDTHTNLIPNTMDNDMNFVGPFERDIQYTRQWEKI